MTTVSPDDVAIDVVADTAKLVDATRHGPKLNPGTRRGISTYTLPSVLLVTIPTYRPFGCSRTDAVFVGDVNRDCIYWGTPWLKLNDPSDGTAFL